MLSKKELYFNGYFRNSYNRIVKVTHGWYKHYHYGKHGNCYLVDNDEKEILKYIKEDKLNLIEEVTEKDYKKQNLIDNLLLLMYALSMSICIVALLRSILVADLLMLLLCIGGIGFNIVLVIIKRLEIVYCINVFTAIKDRDDERNK